MQYLCSRSLLTTPNTDSLGSLTCGMEQGSFTIHFGVQLRNQQILTLLSVIMKTEDRLLKIINGYKTACATNSSTTMENNLVANLLRIYLSIFINTSGMVLSNIFYDRLDNFIILLLRSSVIRPSQILEMSYNPSFCRLAFGICETKLHLPLDKVWHHFLM